MTETIYCYPCNMTFRVEAPRHSRGETTKCVHCGRRFWHLAPQKRGPARVGVWPEDADREEA